MLFIDIILIKPQVYRHLLYNRLGTADDRINVLLLTFETDIAVNSSIRTVVDSIRRVLDMGTR